MRATEALFLSDPDSKLTTDTLNSLSHVWYSELGDKHAILSARKANRKTIKYKPQDASCAGTEAALQTSAGLSRIG